MGKLSNSVQLLKHVGFESRGRVVNFATVNCRQREREGWPYRSSSPHRCGPTEGVVRRRDWRSRPPPMFRRSAILRRNEFYKSVLN